MSELVETDPGGQDLTREEDQAVVILEGSGSVSGDRFTAGEAWLALAGGESVVVETESAARLLCARVGNQPR